MRVCENQTTSHRRGSGVRGLSRAARLCWVYFRGVLSLAWSASYLFSRKRKAKEDGLHSDAAAAAEMSTATFQTSRHSVNYTSHLRPIFMLSKKPKINFVRRICYPHYNRDMLMQVDPIDNLKVNPLYCSTAPAPVRRAICSCTAHPASTPASHSSSARRRPKSR